MEPLIAEGLNLAMLGMGTVFVFLTLLVLATMLMSALVPADAIPAPASATAKDGNERKKLAAITAAIHQHRQRRAG